MIYLIALGFIVVIFTSFITAKIITKKTLEEEKLKNKDPADFWKPEEWNADLFQTEISKKRWNFKL